MPVDGYFDTVFASSGSRVDVPDDVQPDGSVSYAQGYGVDYTLDPAVNPSALNVEQTKMNQLFYDLTAAIQNWQQHATPPFITSTMNGGSAYSYSEYDRVRLDGVVYQSLVDSNEDTPPSANWTISDIASAANVFTGGTTTGSGNAQVLASLAPTSGFSLSNNGQTIICTAGFTNTGSATLEITSPAISPTVIKKDSPLGLVVLTGGEIVAGDTIFLTVNTDGSCLVLTSGMSLGSAAYLDVSTDGTLAANSDSLIPTQKAVKTYVDANSSPFTDSYTSGEVAISTGETDFSHGLGVIPTLFKVVARCKITQAGYSVGDEIDVTSFGSYPGGAGGSIYCSGVSANSTNVTVSIFGTDALIVASKSGGSQFTVNDTNWKFVARAWA